MYTYPKFQPIWKTSNFGIKFAQKNVTNKKFEKINIKIVIGIQQYNSVQNLSDFVELQILGPIFFKKT